MDVVVDSLGSGSEERPSGKKRDRHRDDGRSPHRLSHSRRARSKSRDRDGDHHKHRHHHSSSSRHHRSQNDKDKDAEGHRSKRSRHSSHRVKEKMPDKDVSAINEENDGGMWVEKSAVETTDGVAITAPKVKRDAWMEESRMEIDYTQRGAKKTQDTGKNAKQAVADYQLHVSAKELNPALRDGIALDDYQPEKAVGPVYEFGDSGSDWRMRKLKNVYSRAKEDGRAEDELGVEVFGSLELLDDAREERRELDRREMYGTDRKDYKQHPIGELYRQRKIAQRAMSPPQVEVIKTMEPPLGPKTVLMDQSSLNKLRASLLKAQLRGDPKAAEMEAQYNLAMSEFANRKEPEVVVLSERDNKLLSKSSEAKEIMTGRRKGQMETNQDMTIEDMMREEKRTRGSVQQGKLEAERIAKDGKYDDNLEYMDENAEKLASRVQHNEINLKNMAIGEFKKMQKILDSCPLCHHEGQTAIAPVISLGTRVYLTLPTEPELTPGGAVIVPIQHRNNTLECDDDEWEEIRNFMKCLIRMYHDQGRDVIFYENAASPQRHRHASIEAVPLPLEQGEVAPAFFKEAFLSADEEWSQHKKIIDTLSISRKSLGKQAFRRSIVKEAPYFHVWFEIDGGMGHLIEDQNRWPKGDLFAREVIGGMLDAEPDVIKRQGRWVRGKDRREEGFKKRWNKFDWTRVLLDQ